MLETSQVTACLVTRGDQPAAILRIQESLIFDQIIVWDNSIQTDWKCAGRYMAARMAKTPVVYFQDDDVIVPKRTQIELLENYKPGVMVANWGHGENPDGYEDLPLVCGGAVVDRQLPWRALRRYLKCYPDDDGFRYEADFVAGVLYETFEHHWLPFHIDLAIAQHPSRLCNQTWQRDLKFDITQRARAIRDGLKVAA